MSSESGMNLQQPENDVMDTTDITIRVKTLDSQEYSIAIETSKTILELKHILEQRTTIPVVLQRLIYRGRVLQDSSTIVSNSIQNNHVLHLVARESPPPLQPQQQQGQSQSATVYGTGSNQQQQQQQPGRIHVQVRNAGVGLNAPAGSMQELTRVIVSALRAAGVPGNAANRGAVSGAAAALTGSELALRRSVGRRELIVHAWNSVRSAYSNISLNVNSTEDVVQLNSLGNSVPENNAQAMRMILSAMRELVPLMVRVNDPFEEAIHALSVLDSSADNQDARNALVRVNDRLNALSIAMTAVVTATAPIAANGEIGVAPTEAERNTAPVETPPVRIIATGGTTEQTPFDAGAFARMMTQGLAQATAAATTPQNRAENGAQPAATGNQGMQHLIQGIMQSVGPMVNQIAAGVRQQRQQQQQQQPQGSAQNPAGNQPTPAPNPSENVQSLRNVPVNNNERNDDDDLDFQMSVDVEIDGVHAGGGTTDGSNVGSVMQLLAGILGNAVDGTQSFGSVAQSFYQSVNENGDSESGLIGQLIDVGAESLTMNEVIEMITQRNYTRLSQVRVPVRHRISELLNGEYSDTESLINAIITQDIHETLLALNSMPELNQVRRPNTPSIDQLFEPIIRRQLHSLFSILMNESLSDSEFVDQSMQWLDLSVGELSYELSQICIHGWPDAQNVIRAGSLVIAGRLGDMYDHLFMFGTNFVLPLITDSFGRWQQHLISTENARPAESSRTVQAPNHVETNDEFDDLAAELLDEMDVDAAAREDASALNQERPQARPVQASVRATPTIPLVSTGQVPLSSSFRGGVMNPGVSQRRPAASINFATASASSRGASSVPSSQATAHNEVRNALSQCFSNQEVEEWEQKLELDRRNQKIVKRRPLSRLYRNGTLNETAGKDVAPLNRDSACDIAVRLVRRAMERAHVETQCIDEICRELESPSSTLNGIRETYLAELENGIRSRLESDLDFEQSDFPNSAKRFKFH